MPQTPRTPGSTGMLSTPGKTDIALSGDLIEDRAHSAASGIADNMYIGGRCQDIVHSVPERRTVAGHIGLDSVIIPGEQDRAAVAADIAGHDDTVSRLCRPAGLNAIHNAPYCRRCDENTVHLALAGDLGITGHDADT